MINLLMTFFGITYLPLVMLHNNNYFPTQQSNKIKDICYFWWNFSLSVFSIWGMLKTVPYFVNSIHKYGLISTIINNNCYEELKMPLLLVAPSKIIELGDTFFIAIRGKKIKYIQYFHHWITMLYCWYVHNFRLYRMNVNAMFCCMNYTVHSFMYTWYAISALKIKTPIWIKNSVTIIQIIQMFLGVYLTIIANIYGQWFLKDFYSSFFASCMYLYYSYLFTNLFFKIILKNQKKCS